MPTASEEQAQVANALYNLAQAMVQLQNRYDAAQRAKRRISVTLFVATLLFLSGAGYLVISPVAELIPLIAPPKLATTDPEAAEAKRISLLASLSEQERIKIQRFEEQISWVHDYLDVYEDFRPGPHHAAGNAINQR